MASRGGIGASRLAIRIDHNKPVRWRENGQIHFGTARSGTDRESQSGVAVGVGGFVWSACSNAIRGRKAIRSLYYL